MFLVSQFTDLAFSKENFEKILSDLGLTKEVAKKALKVEGGLKSANWHGYITTLVDHANKLLERRQEAFKRLIDAHTPMSLDACPICGGKTWKENRRNFPIHSNLFSFTCENDKPGESRHSVQAAILRLKQAVQSKEQTLYCLQVE